MKHIMTLILILFQLAFKSLYAQELPNMPEGLELLESNKSQTVMGPVVATKNDFSLASLFDLKGFVETRQGVRTRSDELQKKMSINELRASIELEKNISNVNTIFAANFIYDDIVQNDDVNLRTGKGPIDLRQASVAYSPLDNVDIKAGRQILTWGTGDLVFINDLFPKDWNSFMLGRNMEYLKAPSDAIKASAYTGWVNLNLVWTPIFNPDRLIDGQRISYWNPATSRFSGRNQVLQPRQQDRFGTDDEIAMRLSKVVGSYELALYAYDGFWKTPQGQTSSGEYYYPKLQTVGGSVQGPLMGGIFHIEVGSYHSQEDSQGKNPLIRNSENRFLVGQEMELSTNFTIHGQYYLEQMRDYQEYTSSLPAGISAKKKEKHMVVIRATKRLMNQNLTLEMVAFYSPSEKDSHLRPRIEYKVDDNWTIDTGANIFYGEKKDTTWGQLENASNVYAGLRYNF